MRLNTICVALLGIICARLCCQPIYAGEPAIETLYKLVPGIELNSMPIPEPVLSRPVDAAGVSKGVTNGLTLLILKELGNPPSREEKKIVKKALKALNSSKVGKEICKTIGSNGCTLDNLQAAGVEITTRDLKYHLPEPLESVLAPWFGSEDPDAATPNPSMTNGRTLLCLDKGLVSKNSPEYVATYILHEISHISDNRNLGEVADAAQKYAAEYKAHAVQMMIYDEFLRTGKLKGNTATNGIQFMLSVYRWRNGGPKPNMDYSLKIKNEDKVYSAAELIGLYVKPDDTGLKALWHLTGFYIQRPDAAATDGDMKCLQGVHGFLKELEPKYQLWFPSKLPVVVVSPNNGGGNNGGGNIPHPHTNPNPNPCPYPHFNPDGSAGC